MINGYEKHLPKCAKIPSLNSSNFSDSSQDFQTDLNEKFYTNAQSSWFVCNFNQFLMSGFIRKIYPFLDPAGFDKTEIHIHLFLFTFSFLSKQIWLTFIRGLLTAIMSGEWNSLVGMAQMSQTEPRKWFSQMFINI